MKTYLLGFLISVISFVAATLLINGLSYGHNLEVLAKAAGVFGILEIFIRPVIKILLLPLNFLTMGFLSGVGGIVILWLMSILVPGFSLNDTSFPGFSIYNLALPSYHLGVILTTIVAAAVISLLSSILYWITR
jgi:putative membrane protein